LGNVNSALIQRAIEARFVTLFYAVLKPDGQLTFCNAWHNPPFLVGRNGVRRLETGGVPLGLFAGAPLEEETVTMEPGDFVVTFSDGVSEAFNPAGEEFEGARILDSIERAPGRDVQTQLEYLFFSVRAFTAGAAQNDDITVLVVSYGSTVSE
jgi:sigma-B regulation protein RsbU (phosphoserine phosphatase)